MSVAHLRVKALASASAHEAVATEVGDFQGCHLAGDLPQLRGEEYDGPGELKRCPRRNCDQEGVIRCDCTEIAGEGT